MLCFLTQYEYALKKCQANKGRASFVKWVATNVMKQPETKALQPFFYQPAESK